MTPHSARLHALAAALCALLLLVALCLMAAAHAPWWALLATQGALLVTTASAGMWLDRSQGAGGRGQATERGPREPLWLPAARAEANGKGRPQPPRAGVVRPEDDVFWQEYGPGDPPGRERRKEEEQ